MCKCIARLWKKQNCDVFHCPDCGFGFGDPFIGGDEEFYGILHEQHGYPAWRWDYDFALTTLQSTEAGGHLLDIGAGTGIFLQALSGNWEKYAVEGSSTTREKLRAVGIHVFEDMQSLAEQLPESFQTVTLFQVLEHISQFPEMLRHCERVLEPGGRIIITVPDAEAMQRQERLTGCADMPPNHINKWTPESLRLALGQAGLVGGHATYQPASWATFRSALYLKILARRADPRSVAAQVYRIPVKPIRVVFIALMAIPAFISLAPHFRDLCRGGAFGMNGVKM